MSLKWIQMSTANKNRQYEYQTREEMRINIGEGPNQADNKRIAL